MKEEKPLPPEEVFIEQKHINSSIHGYRSREELAASRVLHASWDLKAYERDQVKEAEPELVFVYKLSHVEVIRQKLEVQIERIGPTARQSDPEE